jgi:hypothetical protein
VAQRIDFAGQPPRERGGDLLVQALSRDMTGVQQSVLSSPEWRYFNGDRPQDMTSLIASGFARYPYPESFFRVDVGLERIQRRLLQPIRSPAVVDDGKEREPVDSR